MRRIVLEQVSRAYGRSFALHRVSMTLEAGTLTALLGANGAGKTTLLNILATLEPPSQGQVFYDRNRWASFAKRGRQHVGWVSHDALLYEDLSGRENLRFTAKMYGLTDAERRIDALLERVGMTHAAEQRVLTYSRGMVQRMTIARALLHDPSLILLDEPLTGLDQRGRADIMALFDELRSAGKLLVMSTHDLHALCGHTDQLCILKAGRLMHCAPSPLNDNALLSAYQAYA